MKTIAGWVLWQDGKPVDAKTVVRPPRGELPARETLGHNDPAEWEKLPSGEPKDPWANTRLIYFTNPETAETYTFSTSSQGGLVAVSLLADQIRNMRHVHVNATPMCGFEWAPWPTRYGMRSRPAFKVASWLGLNGGEEARGAPARLTQEEMREVDRKILDDEIPY
jgi:hypothetical protein